LVGGQRAHRARCSVAASYKSKAARRLHEQGWPYRLIGKVMHITHQRVEQLLKEKS
jgi:hypothetical protein